MFIIILENKNYYVKPSKIYSLGRKSGDIRIDNKFISRSSHLEFITGDVNLNDRDNINAAYPIRVKTNKKLVVVNGSDKDNEKQLQQHDECTLTNNDIIILTKDIQLKVVWSPIYFNVSSLYPSKTLFNSQTLHYSKVGLKFGRGHWNHSYNYLIQPTRVINPKVLGALTQLKPVVNKGFLESVYQSLLSDNIQNILPTVSIDHLPTPVDNSPSQSDTLWLISENRLYLFQTYTFIILVDDKSSIYLDILSSTGARTLPLNVKTVNDLNTLVYTIRQSIELFEPHKTKIFIPSDIIDRLQLDNEDWTLLASNIANSLQLDFIDPQSVDKSILQINRDCLTLVNLPDDHIGRHADKELNNFQIENPSPLFNEDNKLNELNVSSDRLSHELQSNESQSINTKKRKEIEPPSVADEAPKKRLIRRANKDKKGPRFNLDDDDDQPSQINIQQQQSSQQLQSSRKRRVGVKGGKSINIDDSDEDEKYNIPQYAGTVNTDETNNNNNNNNKLTNPPHPSPSDINRRIENQKRAKSISIDNSEGEERQPQQRQTILGRRAGTMRATSINIDDSDEDGKTGSRKIKEQNIQDTANYDSNLNNNNKRQTPSRRRGTKRLRSINIDDSDDDPPVNDKRKQSLMVIQEDLESNIPEPTQITSPIPQQVDEELPRRKTAREIVDEQMAAKPEPGKDFLTQHINRRKNTIINERQEKAEMANAQRIQDANRQAQIRQLKIQKEKEIENNRIKDFDTYEDEQGNSRQVQNLKDCLIPVKYVPLHRRDKFNEASQSSTNSSNGKPNFKKFKKKDVNNNKNRVKVVLKNPTKAQITPRSTNQTIESSEEDELEIF